MKWKESFIPTVKEDPQDAEAVSHRLMIRAGLIRRLSSGSYTYLPLGRKILEKAAGIVREEMNAQGAVELLMPALHPVELWKKTGRYDDMGEVMIKFTDRHGKEIALGPTHEEIITDLVSREIRSYKDLPLTLYQIQTKFRDELRPRFGIVRSCEFLMKDAYSFDVDREGMEASYKKIYDAYCRIFERCGLPYLAVEADPGLMGGTVSHEFMIPCAIGEDRIMVCSSCGYAASSEVAEVKARPVPSAEKPVIKEKKLIDTPGKSTVRDICDLLKRPAEDIIKTLIYIADGIPVAVLIRGDHQANEAKIKKALEVRSLELAGEKKVKQLTGGDAGFSGPVALEMKIVADYSVRDMVNAIAGANEKGRHILNVNPGRDFRPDTWIDARVITQEDNCPKCGENIEMKNAVEIGHTFKLGTKYSVPLGASYVDDKGEAKPIVMGCYGIGVNRILASAVETSYDKDGIIWPVSLSPAEVVVIPVKMDDEQVASAARGIYEELSVSGIDVMIDDRDRSAGIKFKDADLVGFPVQIVVGKKSLAEKKVEIVARRGKRSELVEKDVFMARVKALLAEG
jgi:prolyl-tRNA synthetase